MVNFVACICQSQPGAKYTDGHFARKTSCQSIDICNSNLLISGQRLRCWFSAIQNETYEIIISETLSHFLCRQQSCCSWISLFVEEGSCWQDVQCKGIKTWDLAVPPWLQSVGIWQLFDEKTSVWEFYWRELRVFLQTDERATWIPTWIPGFSNTGEILFYHIYTSRKKSGKTLGWSFVTVTASKVVLKVE